MHRVPLKAVVHRAAAVPPRLRRVQVVAAVAVVRVHQVVDTEDTDSSFFFLK